MTAIATASGRSRAEMWSLIQRNSVLIALLLLVVFGALRYDRFLTVYNITSVLRYNSMFGLIGLGMCFVIITGGIDLSVGAVAALASVVAALASPGGLVPAVIAGTAVGMAVGLLNGTVIAKLRIVPFIVTLATMLASRGLALLISGNQSVSASWETSFTQLGLEGWTVDLSWLGFAAPLALPYPALIMVAAFILGSIALNFTGVGRYALAIGGNEEAARLMGLPVDRVLIGVYALSGAMAGLAGVILAAQFGTGQPTEGVGWELLAIAAVVVGGTLLTGGIGSVGSTLSGVLLLGLIFNILNFENGRGWISLSAYWQSVIRGLFLLLVVVLQSRLQRRRI